MISSISFENHSEDRPRDFFRIRVTLKRKENRGIKLVSEYSYTSFSYFSGVLRQCYLTNLILGGFQSHISYWKVSILPESSVLCAGVLKQFWNYVSTRCCLNDDYLACKKMYEYIIDKSIFLWCLNFVFF